ncbi:M20 aminoacylase family protein [Microbaculum marinum]|uniref:M20 aminoacylase family protein n=1 Tax=Microbaculum marinum TaxID=1764581 RepID=A0AAW9RYT7_9HYPH
MNLVQDIADAHPELIGWRRTLHAMPETGFEEFRTADFVDAKLKEFGIETKRGMATTGVVGTLSAGSSGKTIALRSELDAINLQEANDFAHRSTVDGKMHGCGHDGHMTMLLAAARHLARTRDFDGTVHFIFQPAEEVGNGGLRMIEDGLFEAIRPEAVYGMHNFPGIPVGQFATRPGDFMASLDAFDITIEGVGGHGAYPSKARTPILPACAIVSALNEHVASQIPSEETMSLSVAQLNAGSAINVIPASANIKGTVRSLGEAAQLEMEAAVERIAKGICGAYGVDCTVSYQRTYPRLVNAARETASAIDAAAAVVGADNVDSNGKPMMASEDFAWMLREKPGNYIAIGNGIGDKGGTFVHHPKYDFNDDILPIGASYWVSLVRRLL